MAKLTYSDFPNHIKSVPLKPLCKVKAFTNLRAAIKFLAENIYAVVHIWFVSHET